MTDPMIKFEESVALQLLHNRVESSISVPRPPDPDLRELLPVRAGDLSTELLYERDANTGEVTGYVEQCISSDASGTPLLAAHHSTTHHHLYGQISSVPFMPGGMETDVRQLLSEQLDNDERVDVHLAALDTLSDLLDVPPGWSGSVTFDETMPSNTSQVVPDSAKSTESPSEMSATPTDDFMSLMDLVYGDDLTDIAVDVNDKLNIVELPSIPINDATTDNADTSRMEQELLTSMSAQPLVMNVDSSTVTTLPTTSRVISQPTHSHATIVDVSRVPDGYEALKPRMVKKYPFELDPWQQHAVMCLENGDSVFVAAHTSAGKTVVAEYAIAMSQKHHTRAVYTSPIKALSNQKFHDFRQMFGEVGLITGDIQLHSDAFCLVMTTEIIRSMLYNGSELIRELEWVVFDEVHYINDAERGVVWEEVLIMLPAHVKIIMLSATAPNSREFADWVGRIKKRQIYVMTTSKRPVPLEHYIYTGQDGKTKNERFLVVDRLGKYAMQGYKQAMEALSNRKKSSPAGGGRGRGGGMGRGRGGGGGGGGQFQGGGGSEKGLFITLFDHLKTSDQLPVVIFTFSRKRCDENAAMLTSVDLTTAMEKRSIHNFFTKCINRLKGSDKKLPQVLQMQDLCKRGLAVHHSGILPILKEVVEMLFQQGFVKILFATETFAMGVNMPARTVVFDSMRKHDGIELRDLTPGEYTQMAGRAGRRGLDSTGTVIVLCKHGRLPDSSDMVKMMLGTPTPLASHFRVTYGLLLNVLRVEQLRVEDVLRRSYAESKTLRSTSNRKQRLAELNDSHSESSMVWPECSTCTREAIDQYDQVTKTLLRTEMSVWMASLPSQAMHKALGPGRVIILNIGTLARRIPALLIKLNTDESGVRRCDVFVAVDDELAVQLDNADAWPWRRRAVQDESGVNMDDYDKVQQLQLDAIVFGDGCAPLGPGRLCERLLCDVPVEYVFAVTQTTIKVNTLQVKQDMMLRIMPRFRNQSPDGCIRQLINDLQRLSSEWGVSVPLLRCTDLASNDLQMVELKTTLRDLQQQYDQLQCRHCPQFKHHFTTAAANLRLIEERDRLLHSLSTASLLLKPEFDSKIRCLQQMGFIDREHMVQLKAKVACELHNQEVLITELMLENALQGLTNAEIAAMLSCITCQHKSEAKMDERMKKLYERITGVAERIQTIQKNNQVTDREDDITLSLRNGLMRVVYEWASGMPFADIMQLTDAQEGNIVRCIQRLDETLRDVRNAARMVGDTALVQSMMDTSTAIKRDIVFAASLWTQD